MNTHNVLITTSIIALSSIGMFVFAQQHQFAQESAGSRQGQSLGQHFAQHAPQDGTCPNGMTGTQTQQRLHDPANHTINQDASPRNQTRQQQRDPAQCALE